MRIAIIAPYSTGPMRGNITTVRRVASGLQATGADVAVLPMDTQCPAAIQDQLKVFSPDIIHAFHAGICGEVACTLAEQRKVPCVITITGSDINEARFRESSGMTKAMALAHAVVCFDTKVAAEVVRFFPCAGTKIAVIPQGILPLTSPPASWPGISGNDFVLLLPAAIRPVKNLLFPLRVLAPLFDRLSDLKLVLAGGIIDPEYAAIVFDEVAASSHAVWLGDVPYEQMGSLYSRADVVLNCSLHEDMPNSLLEAMALGRAVLAADIPGNQVLIRNNETGWLYHNESEFLDIIQSLHAEPEMRTGSGRRAREYVLSHFPPHLETGLYLELFTKLRDN